MQIERFIQNLGLITTVVVLGAAGRPREVETVYYDTVTPNGTFAGGKLVVPVENVDGFTRSGVAGVTTLVNNGPSSNRIDLVFVGDGYLASELGNYATHVDNAWNAFFSVEPLASYLPMFNVHRVDVISNESGVDNDPVQGILKDTAMDMGFWCSGIERLLCVNTSLAWSYANNVPSADIVLAVANSSKYGGAGYTASNIATFAGANSAATEIAIHEVGHSLGDLADEYEYGGSTNYSGPEPQERNVSIYTAAQMASNGLKWANWLGENNPQWDGLVDTFEGAMYSFFGIYRPTNNSMMRSLGRPFNQPSVESFIIEMYNIVNPIDNATPFGFLDGSETIFIEPINVGHPMQVQWFIDDVSLGIDGQTSVDLSTMTFAPGLYALQVDVVDPTAWVRDEVARQTSMKQRMTWVIQIIANPCAEDFTGDGIVAVNDLLSVINVWGPCAGCPEDLDGNSIVDVSDLLAVISAWGPCP